ncbi:MAG: 4-hydroxy-tetrahydrodipicolinate synthase [Alphaproteobacteria bacterium]|nr:4-hydroxy-tetrahydrodipicolinate synthase [Alphaproteobacteria bacterium]
MFKGLYTALITPFNKAQIDEEAFVRLVEFQIAAGVDGLVVCGTTGESAVMTAAEYEQVVRLCIKTAGGRVPVIVGTGGNNTRKVIENTQFAKAVGADAALIVTPYYNKPTQQGLFEHYSAVHDATDLPIILYNVPGRTGVSLNVDTIARLSALPRIAGIKDATPDIMRPLKIRAAVRKRDFSVLSGEDASIVAFLAHGGDGCVSVTANIAPALCAGVHKAWREKNWAELERLRDLLWPLHEVMFIETNPSPVKYAASLLGYGDGTLRLPLCEPSEASKERIGDALRSVKITG